MTKQDWIILRLLLLIAKANSAKLRSNVDSMRSIVYLVRKYGGKQIVACIDQLNGEYK